MPLSATHIRRRFRHGLLRVCGQYSRRSLLARRISPRLPLPGAMRYDFRNIAGADFWL